MNVTVSRHIRTTYSVREPIKMTAPDLPAGRGVYYRPDSDDAAHDAARPKAEAAIAAIRAKAKAPDGPVAWTVQRGQSGELSMLAEMTVVTNQGGAA